MDEEMLGSEIKDYIDTFYIEGMIENLEIQILALLKAKQENIPSEKNDREWKEFSNYVCKRREMK